MAKSKINNPHDKFVKEMFADKQMALAFLETKLPDNILALVDLFTFTPINTSFINKNLNQYFADLIYKFKLKNADDELYISILIENKSVTDEYVLFQIIEYLGGAYRKQIQTKEFPIPVLPFIYYHGNNDWHIREIKDFFLAYPKEILAYLPSFKYEFISLQSMSDEDIGKIDNKMLYAALMMQRHRNDSLVLESMLIHLFKSIENYTDWNFLHTIIVYSLNVTEISEEKIVEITETTDPNFKEIVMSTYDRILTKGIDLGIEKGIDLGIEKAMKKAILNGYNKGLSIAMICNINELSEEYVLKVLKEN